MSDSPDSTDAAERLRIFEIGKDRYLRPITNQEPSPEWLHDEKNRWVAGRGHSLNEIAELCEECGIDLPPQIVERIRNPPARPDMVRLDNLLFATYSISQEEGARRVMILCAPSTILTFHESGELMEEVSGDCQNDRRLRIGAPLAVFLELVEAALRRLSDRMFDLRRTIMTATDALEKGTEDVDSEDLLVFKKDATNLEIQLEDLLACLSELGKYDSEALNPEPVWPLVLQLQANIDRGLGAMARMKNRIEDLHNFQVRQADETTNRRLKVLTVLSAVYLPPTLIAAIYGMNFEEIPILSVPFGYALVMAIMVAIVVGQLAFFYKRGWFE